MKIIGTGSALPKKTLTNDELAQFLDTSDEWISSRTGIRSRQIITDETLVQLGSDAARRALENAGVEPAEIDMLICSTVMGDTSTPGLSCSIAGELGISGGVFDINAACAGFVYALDIAHAYITTGKARKILVVCAEAMSRLCDWTDRSTAVLFGDGAGACVVSSGDGEDYLASVLTVKPDSSVLVAWPEPGNSPFATNEHPYGPLYMAGQDVYKFAVSAIVRDTRAVLERAGRDASEVSTFVLHQANLRIIEAAQQRLKQPPEKFPHNIERRGNSSSASVPMLLDELNRSGALAKGQLLLMSAFGAGLSTGACLIRWAI